MIYRFLPDRAILWIKERINAKMNSVVENTPMIADVGVLPAGWLHR
jgi:hypothetical protein